ncbi:MAG: hypothetical protein GF311_28095 [Candidatus Lokiarchaeota archaeon]|nr:hypothetical protein [Candidatus Lokiarchaeota archaeon]
MKQPFSYYNEDILPRYKRIDFKTKTSLGNMRAGRIVCKDRVDSIWIHDSGGGLEDPYFKKIYKTEAFQKIWPIENTLF